VVRAFLLTRGHGPFHNRQGMSMYRYFLMPHLEDVEGNNTKKRMWRRIFYAMVLTSVELFLAIIALFTGIPVLLDPIGLSLVPLSITKLMPVWMVDLWGFQLLIGGLITGTGILSGDFRIEQIGVLLLFAGAFVYTVALATILPGSWVAFITYVLFALSMAARYWVLSKLIKLTRNLMKEVGSKEES
jgi:hypothetical protein